MTSSPVDIGTLIVVILKAKNLPNKRHIGKQDPYCSVKLNDETRRTKAVRRGGQHPEWDEEVRFTIFEDVEDELARTATGDGTDGTDPPPPPPKKDKKKSKSGKKMQLTCYADDPREPDLIGETMVDLTEVLTKGETDEWFSLSNKDKYCGEVYLELTFWSNEKPPEKRTTPQASTFHPQYGGPGSFRPSPEVPAALKHGGSNQNTPSPSRIPSSSGHDVPLPSSLRPSGSLAQVKLYTAPYEQHKHHGDHALDQLANGMADLGVGGPSQRRESFPPVQGAPSEFGFTGPFPSHQRDSFSRMSSGSVSSTHSLGPPSLRGRPPQSIHPTLSSLPEPFVHDDYAPGPPHQLPPVSETYPPQQPYQYPHAPSGFATPPPSQTPIPRQFTSPPPVSHAISSGFAPPQPPSSAMSFHPPQPPSSAMSFHPPQPPSSAMNFHPPQPPSSAMSFHPPQPPSSTMSFHPPQPPPPQYTVPSQTPFQYPPHPQPPASAPPHQYPPSDAPLPPPSVPPVSHSAPPQQYAHNGEPSPPHQNYQGLPPSNAYQQIPISYPPPGSRPLPNPQVRTDHHSPGGFVSPPPGPPPPIAPGNAMFPNAMPFQPPGPPPPPPHRGSLPPTPTKPSVSYPPPPPPPLQNGEHPQPGSQFNTPPRPPLPPSQSYDRHSPSPSPHGSFPQPPHQPQGFTGPWPPPPPPPPPSISSYSGPAPQSNFSTPPPQGQQPYNHGQPPHPAVQFPAGPAWTPPQQPSSQHVSYGSQDGWRQ